MIEGKKRCFVLSLVLLFSQPSKPFRVGFFKNLLFVFFCLRPVQKKKVDEFCVRHQKHKTKKKRMIVIENALLPNEEIP